jgi:glycosyltransferase involved in cell wall biosynthesis
MSISGFSFARNADKLGYPVAESILSILPVCDEFVVAIGKGDADDKTRLLVESIGSEKIKIIDTEWTDRETLKNAIYSQQTNIALRECKGDWCFYIQADEVLHEKYLETIVRKCELYKNDPEIEGLLFAYRHFWGDYDHYQAGHAWYPNEIRIVRNGIGVESIGDAQSFRIDTRKLRVARAEATMFHYGYVRDSRLMQTRNVEIETTYRGKEETKKLFAKQPKLFDYGTLQNKYVFTGSHPAVLEKRIKSMNWKHLLQYSGKDMTHFHHDKVKYKILSFLEKTLLGGKQIGGYKNYILLKK